MGTLILRDLSFSRDFRSIKWGATLQYNLLRAFCAGVIITCCMLFSSQFEHNRVSALIYLLLWPLGYLIFFIPLVLLLSFLSSSVPFAGLLALLFAILLVSIGDPVVCVLKRLFPKLVPAERPPLFSTNLLNFILEADEIAFTS